MAYSVKNVIVGAAALFVTVGDSVTTAGWFVDGQPSGPNLPTLTGGAYLALSAAPAQTDWRHVGFTTGGITFSYEPSFGDIMVDQLLDSAKIFKDGMKVNVKTTLSEPTLANLLLAWGAVSSASTVANTGTITADISGGNLGDEPVERGLAFVGPAPRDSTGAKRERVYSVRRALQVVTTAHSLDRKAETSIPVEFRCLPDATVSGNSYGKITDRLLT